VITPTPLEKQLVNVDLTKGMDERARPETMGGVTLIENLVTDQTGAWVKRDGTYFGPPEDASGNSGNPVSVKKIIPFINGWGCIADGVTLLHKKDSTSNFSARQRLMDWSVTSGYLAGSSGPVVSSGTFGPYVRCVASSTTHDAFVYGGKPQSSTRSGYKLCITERATGSGVTYDLDAITYASANGSGGDAQMVFVGDRFLHVYQGNNQPPVGASSTDISLFVIDTGLALPRAEGFISSVYTVRTRAGGLLQVKDAVGGTSRSWVLIYDGVAGTEVYARNPDGSAIDSVSFAADIYASMSANETTGKLWLATNCVTAATNAKFTALSTTITATVTFAAFTGTQPSTFICATDNATDTVLLLFNGIATNGTTFGASTIPYMRVGYLDVGAPVTTTIGSNYGWGLVSRPFYSSSTRRWYAQMSKAAEAGLTSPPDVSSHAIVCLWDSSGLPTWDPGYSFRQFYTNTSALAVPFGSFRNACNIDPMLSYRGLGKYGIAAGLANDTPLRYTTFDSGQQVVACVAQQLAQRVGGVGFCTLMTADATAMGSCNFSGSTYVAHGGLNSYDGKNLVDQGFTDSPYMVSAIGAAGLLSGSYRYVAVYRHVDSNGVSTYSKVSAITSTVNVLTQSNITIQPHGVTNRDSGKGDSQPIVELYRTKSGGTQYYICATSASSSFLVSNLQQIVANATTGLLTVSDNLSDTTLGSMATMYRQPGTPNAAADRYAAPAGKIVVQHKDRLFCVDPFGQKVYYSSFFVDGESPWFNPAFNFYMHAGSGPITAMASMDGRLFIFKRDQVFVVDGDGPGEAGPTGNEYSPPQALASRYGCVDHRSVVVTPQGIMYRSTRGIELLSRNLKVEWVGERVQNTVDANLYTTGCAMGPDARIYWTLAAGKNTVNGLYYVTGATVVYDTSADAWSVHRHTGYTGVYGHARQHVAFVQEPLAGTAGAVPVEAMVQADGYIGLWMQDFASSKEDSKGQVLAGSAGLLVPMTIETGWIKQGMTARQRVSDLLFLAKKRAGSNHAIKLSIAYDYSDTYTQTYTWEPGTVVSTMIEEVNIQPAQQQVLAIRLKVQDQAPADQVTYPVGLGKCDALAIVAEVAPKQGSPKLAAAQKA